MADPVIQPRAPRCPNHAVVLQKTNDKGVGICPISGAHSTYDYDDVTVVTKVDKFGNLYKEPKITPMDGEEDY